MWPKRTTPAKVSVTTTKGEDSLSDWMSKLAEKKKLLPLSQLSIPGSHDSFTYSLNKTFPVGPDEPNWMRKAGKVFSRATKAIIYRWAKCQTLSSRQQLMHGIRYFDIRIAKCPEKVKGGNKKETVESLRVIHGLFGDEIIAILSDINAFLDEHPGEVVILDFQHIFEFQKEDHMYMVSLIKSNFGPDKLCPFPTNGPMYSLKKMLDSGHRVIVIYPALAGTEDFLWPRQLCPNPWPNTMKLAKLTDCLNQGLVYRDPNILFVSQGVLTPTTGTVALHPFSTLKKTVSTPCNNFLAAWLKSKEVGSNPPNIVICDFPEENSLSKTVVELNMM